MDVDLSNQVVRVLGIAPVKNMTEALEQTGRKARLIGQGTPDGLFYAYVFLLVLSFKTMVFSTISTSSRFFHVPEIIQCPDSADFLVSAAVAEFKGPEIFGVVRFAQVSMELARIEANFSGLSPGKKHAWSINEFGDLTRGAASTGKIFNPTNQTEKEVHFLHLFYLLCFVSC